MWYRESEVERDVTKYIIKTVVAVALATIQFFSYLILTSIFR